ncbi:MAG: PadR family transcriptional regulator [Actinobacteria bacterium]|nr:PadR family transcriptional regulator [Actinomycetota bacterium]
MTTLGYAILGLLSREELSGYDVAGRMRARVGHFWEAWHSQIYPELARLEEAGLATHRVVEQRGRPDKKVYKITPAGLETLKEWVTEPPVPRPARDELVLKAYSLWLVEGGGAIALFRDQEQRHGEKLLEYESIRAWMEKEWGEEVLRTDSPRFASYAALQRGIVYERGYAEWCRWVAEQLAEGQRTKRPRKPKAV